MNINRPSDPKIALSLQRALLGAVTPNLRAVGFRYVEPEIIVTFVFDGPVPEEDVEAAQIVTTEVISDFPETGLECREDIIRADRPEPLPRAGVGRLVYARKE